MSCSDKRGPSTVCRSSCLWLRRHGVLPSPGFTVGARGRVNLDRVSQCSDVDDLGRLPRDLGQIL
eukprot:2005997-Prorocentrum_lima.AAC.1